jgi:predicted transposase YbfD/YdcC
MAQYSKAKRLLASLEKISDFRVDVGKIQYKLTEVLFMVIFALLKGNTTFKDIFGWMIYNKNNLILKEIFNKDVINIPSKSTLHYLLINTDNEELEKVFREYFSDYIKKDNVAIDGKWLKGSDINGQYTNQAHKLILNILDKDNKIVFAHKFMDKNKKNEIKALEEAFDENIFSDDGQIFSFDALHTQTTILNEIDKRGNKYIAKVKDNQKKLKNQIIDKIEELKKPVDTYVLTNPELSHNKKYVTRKVEVFNEKSMKQVMHNSKFTNIQSLIKMTKVLVDSFSSRQKIISRKVEFKMW